MSPVSIGEGLVVFFAVAGADVCWSKYTMSMVAGKKLPAALWSAAIVGLGSLSVLAYVASPAFVIPAMLGAFVGTLVGML